jgi:hypothetical protein
MRLLITLSAIIVFGVCASSTLADSAPVGPLPAGPIASIEVQHGELVALALPRRSAGRVWRVARHFDPNLLHEVSEASVGASVVLVFRAGKAGRVTISVALTKGEGSTKALEARQFRVHIR